ncbi:MAG: hypothetical protein LBF12_00665 [Christensenellaceae bacterium]|jgi:DNA-binding Lrp family transcriptional regulator|nr:hypothetical protein [Christensenellaceae bacterium]
MTFGNKKIRNLDALIKGSLISIFVCGALAFIFFLQLIIVGSLFSPHLVWFTIFTVISVIVHKNFVKMKKIKELVINEQTLQISEIASKTNIPEPTVIKLIKEMLKKEYLTGCYYNETKNALCVPEAEPIAYNTNSSDDIASTVKEVVVGLKDIIKTTKEQQPKITNCPSCGASIVNSKNGICDYCGTRHGVKLD